MKIAVRYETIYSYGQPVSFSPHLFRLIPRADHQLTVRRLQFQTNDGAITHFRRDLFDNQIASCFYPASSARLEARLDLELDVEEKNAFAFLLADHAVDFPFSYRAEEARALAPYLDPEGFDAAAFWQAPAREAPTIETLTALNRAVYDHVKYEARLEGLAFTPRETLDRRKGACRDFAVLLGAALRSLGVAARLVSGYLCEFRTAASERRADGSLHAWTEAYLPGAGWVGFDPTNGILCTHHHLAAAVGISPTDITPVSGRFFHHEKVVAQMGSSLEIDEIT